METNETRKGKYSKIILKENNLQKWRNQIKSKKWEKLKLVIMKKNPTWKRMRCVFFLQTSNLHRNKQKYKSEKETFFNFKKIIITENT
jgi:hypothetical protein